MTGNWITHPGYSGAISNERITDGKVVMITLPAELLRNATRAAVLKGRYRENVIWEWLERGQLAAIEAGTAKTQSPLNLNRDLKND